MRERSHHDCAAVFNLSVYIGTLNEAVTSMNYNGPYNRVYWVVGKECFPDAQNNAYIVVWVAYKEIRLRVYTENSPFKKLICEEIHLLMSNCKLISVDPRGWE